MPAEKRLSLRQKILDLLFPRRCMCCRGLSGPEDLCPACREKLHPVPENACPFCGRGKEYCECHGGTDIRGKGTVSAYYYDETGRTLMRRFKFGPDPACFDRVMKEKFLSDVKAAYGQTGLTAITAVPLHKEEKDRFFVPGYIAKAAADVLGVPYQPGFLIKSVKNTPQHTMPKNKRKENVAGVFAPGMAEKIQGGNILLVDDIATSFSTLEECTRILCENGAAGVWWATLCTTPPKNKRQEETA